MISLFITGFEDFPSSEEDVDCTELVDAINKFTESRRSKK